MPHVSAARRFRTGRGSPCAAEPFEPRLLMAVFTVTTTGDAGPGSLRQAITSANSAAGADVIAFNIPGGGIHAIRPTSPLPDVSDPVEINGRTQPGAASGDVLIELDGSGAGRDTSGLTITAGDSAVRSIRVTGFGGNGIVLRGAGGNTVESCYIGVGANTLTDAGNGRSGVYIDGSPGNVVNATPWGNSRYGVLSGNGRYGVEVVGAASVGNGIAFNVIGTGLDSVTPVPNDLGGVLIDGARDTAVGSFDEPRFTAANVISGNGGPGVTVSGATASGTFIGDNAIGVDYHFERVVGNDGEGVLIRNGAHDNRIGDLSSSSAYGGNVIGGNGGTGGVRIADPGSSRNAVRGNFIGTNFAGTAAFGNGPLGAGVLLEASGNIVGGSDPGTGNFGANRIAFNKTGVGVSGGSGNTITENSIYANENLGIDLNLDGVTPNDGDARDAGPNHLQDFPVLTDVAQATTAEGVPGTRMRGTLNSTPNTRFRLHFYSSGSPDGTGYGEGQTYRGAADVTTDAAGQASFDVVVFARQPNTGEPGKPAPAGEWATATATAPGGSTSEFSRAVPVAGVVGRRVFYNNSGFDGRDPAANAVDDNAVAPDITAVLPGGFAGPGSFTTYFRGINGVMVDMLGLPAGQVLTPADFGVKVLVPGGEFVQIWADGPAPTQVAVRRGAGIDRTDRVTLLFADGALRNTWAQITVKANERTGLTAPDVFYFGHLAGETEADSIRSARVNALDLAAVKRDLTATFGTTVPITFRSDHNHDGRVNALDVAVVRANLGAGLTYLTPQPPAPPPAAPAARASALLEDGSSVLS